MAHCFPYDEKLRLLAHSRSFLANQKPRNAIVGAENLLIYVICEIDYKGRTPEIKNSTAQDNNQDVAGIRRAAHLPANIHLNPNHNCYLQYFLNGQPPTVRTANLQNMRYICQALPNQPGVDYYASMHDEGRGIPAYSGYVLYAGNINFQAQGGFGWIRTAGNVLT